MGTEQLYFIIGFLLGVLLVGCVTILSLVLYNEWIKKPTTRKTDDLFD